MFPISISVPTRFPALVTYGLIATNVIVFLLQLGLSERADEVAVYAYGLVPARYSNPAWALRVGLNPNDYLPFVTNTFMHAGWLHLILNMWTLWLFGPSVEDRLGGLRYLGFYLVCGITASGVHAWMNSDSVVPIVGASGAIAGVLGAHFRLFPLSNVVVLVPIIFIPLFFTVPSFIYIAIWFITQVFQGVGSSLMPDAGGIAWWAHIGGFVAGAIIGPFLCCSPRTYRPHYRDEGVMGHGPWGGWR